MKRWIARPWLWALPTLLSLLASPASAQSITCFGSIIITSLGTEGMTVQVPDGMTVSTTAGSGPAFAPDGTATVTGPASIDIKPLPPVKPGEPMPNGTGGETPGSAGGGSGTAQSGPVDPTVREETAIDPSAPLPVETPVETPVEPLPVDSPVVTDSPPPTVDDPILTTTVDVPAVPDTVTPDGVQTLDGDAVLDTPEPATLTLLALGGVGALVARRKRRTA